MKNNPILFRNHYVSGPNFERTHFLFVIAFLSFISGDLVISKEGYGIEPA
jgi:hypothetical protein